MIFTPTHLNGAFLIDVERSNDARGFFARSWCQDEFEAWGLEARLAQCSISFNRRKGTLRGLHYQTAPHEESKLVRCTMGAVYDVIVDLRDNSPTCGQWLGAELTSDNHRMLYAPKGFAHGFQTLIDNAEVFYQISECHHPECAQGLRWDSPELSIIWPVLDPILSERDQKLPAFGRGVEHG